MGVGVGGGGVERRAEATGRSRGQDRRSLGKPIVIPKRLCRNYIDVY